MIQEILREWEVKYPCVNIKAKKKAIEKFELSILRCGCQNCNLLKELEKPLKRVEKKVEENFWYAMRYTLDDKDTELVEKLYETIKPPKPKL